MGDTTLDLHKKSKVWSFIKKWIIGDVKTLIFLIIILMIALMYKQDIETCQRVISNPCLFCNGLQADIPVFNFNLSKEVNNENIIPGDL